jgi:putative glutathione S-transferase
MLVDGKWMANWQPVQATDAKGGYARQISSFRHWITPDGVAGPTGEDGFKAETGRHHLYVALTCPWASRTLIAYPGQLRRGGAAIEALPLCRHPLSRRLGGQTGAHPSQSHHTLGPSDRAWRDFPG